MEIADVMARRKNVCSYLDIALQHISDNVLANMRRHIDGKATRELRRVAPPCAGHTYTHHSYGGFPRRG